MKTLLDKKILHLATIAPVPIFVVGGFVRNFLICGCKSKDIDLASTISTDQLKELLITLGASDFTEFPLTGTLIFKLNGKKYEYTRFRKESYINGEHRPTSVEFVEDIYLDATRRDFKCNAVYYDIKNDKIVDPLGGIEDIKNKVLDTVVEPDKVLGSDGIRLLRLARFCGELGFMPTQKVLDSAIAHIENLKDISGERALNELKAMFVADKKHSFSPKDGHIKCVNTLKKINAFSQIFTNCKDTNFELFSTCREQLREYAFYIDLIESDLSSNLLCESKKAKESNKIVAVFNAVNSAKEIKSRAKIKEYLVKFYPVYELAKELITNKRIHKVFNKLQDKNFPFTQLQLAITAKDLMDLGYKNEQISKKLTALWQVCQKKPRLNKKQKLLDKARLV